METQQIQKITDAEYFGVKALSASQIKQFDKGAYWFWKSSPYNPDKDPEKETDALIFGKLCHCLLLEPAHLQNEYAIVDFGASRKNKKYEAAKAENPGKIVITQDELDRAMKMIANVKNHKLASTILDGATAEMPFMWTDKETGIPCKAKLDAIKRTKNGLVLIDYKTSSSIPDLLKHAQKSQYILQAAFYCECVKEKYGEYPCEFVFIIQSNVLGEEDIVCVANVEQESFNAGKTIMRSHMESIKTKMDIWEKTKDPSVWSAYPERELMSYSNYYLTYGSY